MNSVWTETITKPCFESLKGDAKTDVLIVGGGIAGILCAHKLQKAGINYILVEADEICSGVTKNTTAKITLQHGLIYDKLIKTLGCEKAALYLDSNKKAIQEYRELCKNIECNFTEKDAFVYSLLSREKIEKEVSAYERIGQTAEFIKDLPLPFSVAGAVMLRNQAHFHPLKFLYSIAEGLNIKEHTKVLEFTPEYTLTNKGKIKAEKIIVATHFPIINKHGSYFLKMFQHRSYVIALENAANVNGMYIDENEKGLSFRNYENLLLLGGGSHRTGKNGGNWAEIKKFAKKYYPHAKVKYQWSTQDCKTLDDIPYIGMYSKNTPNVYVATGFNKWGFTSAMVAADILTDIVRNIKNPYSDVFSPSRSIIKPQLAINAAEAVISLITPTAPRCPHMGCALKYNRAEHSWDCPCHGSRFSYKGELIDNPATDDIKK